MQATSDQSTSTSNAPNVRRQQIVAFSMLLVLLVGGGALAWWKFHVPTPDEPLIDVARGRGGMRGMMQPMAPPQPPRDGVNKTGSATSSSYEIRSGTARMLVSKNTDEWRFNWRYSPTKNGGPEQSKFLAVKYRSLELGLTDAQKKALDAMPPFVSGMVVSEDDQAKLKDLWTLYIAADDAGKKQREADLVKLLAEVGARSEKPTLDAIDARVEKIKAILTPEQLAKVTQPRSPSSPPGTPPASDSTSGAATSRPVR
jgi:hypothetical protein